MNPLPPYLFYKFFLWFCRRDLRYHIEGDLLELFHENVNEKGLRKARWMFAKDVLKLFRPRMIRSFSKTQTTNPFNMSKHNLIVAIRRLYRNGWNSSINILGLAFGLTSIIFMLFYIQYETTYDSFNTNSERLYRIERTRVSNRLSEVWDNTPYPLSKELVSTIPEIESAANIRSTADYLSFNELNYLEKNGLYADNSFLSIFTFDFTEGNSINAIEKSMSIVISESLAKKFDPAGKMLGKTIQINKRHDLLVTGIFKDHPYNSHLSIDYIISFESFKTTKGVDVSKNWQNNSVSSYVLLSKQNNQSTVDKKVSNFLSSYVEEATNYEEHLSLRPVGDIYLKTSKVRGGFGKRSEITIIYLFYAVVVFTALITALNYLNSTTAQMMNRELEIGIRKVMGSMKQHLAYQFLIESLVIITVAFLLAVGLAYLMLPTFNVVVNRSLVFSFENDLYFFLKIFIGSLSVAALAGIYPVVYLSSLKISAFLQGMSTVKRKATVRKSLVVFQLLVSIPLIFSSILITEQINYLENRDVGFNKNNILRTSIAIETQQDQEALKSFKNSLLQQASISNVSLSGSAPFYGADQIQVNWQGGEIEDRIGLRIHKVDYDFIDTYQMPLVAGRNFSEAYSTDVQNAVIINETAMRIFGWEDAIGKTIMDGTLTVIGVVKDFNDYTLFKRIPPMALQVGTPEHMNFITIRSSDGQRALAQNTTNDLLVDRFPQELTQVSFMDVDFDRSYLSSLGNVTRMFIFFTLLAMILVIMGLYSLVSYSSKMQQKMIAIRKVLGAPVKGLFLLLLREYIWLYSIAAVIGLTSTYIVAVKVIGIFPYHTAIKPTYLLVAGVIALVVVVLSVGTKILSTVSANPVDSISKDRRA